MLCALRPRHRPIRLSEQFCPSLLFLSVSPLYAVTYPSLRHVLIFFFFFSLRLRALCHASSFTCLVNAARTRKEFWQRYTYSNGRGRDWIRLFAVPSEDTPLLLRIRRRRLCVGRLMLKAARFLSVRRRIRVRGSSNSYGVARCITYCFETASVRICDVCVPQTQSSMASVRYSSPP